MKAYVLTLDFAIRLLAFGTSMSAGGPMSLFWGFVSGRALRAYKTLTDDSVRKDCCDALYSMHCIIHGRSFFRYAYMVSFFWSGIY